jgi:hypothetical protein
VSYLFAIKTHAARAEQVRAIATARDLTVAGLLDRIVAEAIAAGTIGPDLPGFEATGYLDAGRPTVRLILGAAWLPDMAPELARHLATIIAELATTRGRNAGRRLGLGGHDLTIARKGNGLIIRAAVQDLVSGVERSTVETLSFAMALDLVGMIRRAADAADAAEREALAA